MPIPPVINNNELKQRIQTLENLLGIQGAGVRIDRILDTSGFVRVNIGLLPNGDYGIMLQDPNTGNTQELLTGKFSTVPPGTSLTTSSTSPVTIAAAPSVKCTIGASGNALFRMSSNLLLPGGNTSTIIGGWCNLLVDGVTPAAGPFLGAQYSVSAAEPFGGFQGNVMSEYFYGGMTPGVHTFTLQFYSQSGQSISFNGFTLAVEPV